MKTFYFLAGLPRSGSTVLASILNQNPGIYVTPTSPMLDLLIANQNAWYDAPSVKANPFPEQLTNITRAMIAASWQHRPENIIIDKNRGWMKNIEASEILFNKKVKMVVTTRDLPSIMASWLRLIKDNTDCYFIRMLKGKHLKITDDSILSEMWFNMVKDCMEGLKNVKLIASDRILLIDYDNFVNNPYDILNNITTFLELPIYNYDINNIINDTHDDDLTAWGLDGMHTIRPILQKQSNDPRMLLGDHLYNRFIHIEKQYN